MRRLMTSAVAVVVLGTTVLTGAPAQAASSITIRTITTSTLAYQGSTVVKPKVSASRSTKVTSSRLTVRKAGRTVARNVRSVRLKAATYAVTTTVKYKVRSKGRWSGTRTKTRTQRLVVRQAAQNCAWPSNVAAVVSYEDLPAVDRADTLDATSRKLFSAGTAQVEVTLGAMYEAAGALGDTATQKVVAEIMSHYDRSTHIQFRDYRMCGSTKTAEIVFVGGEAWFKEIS
ncbi:MAG: hypothetical protein PGN07_04910 [Aeromicrobium erythreum]